MSDDEERQLRIDQMTVNIEKMRFDMDMAQRKLDADRRRWVWQVVLGLAGTMAASVAAGAAMLGLILHWMGKI